MQGSLVPVEFRVSVHGFAAPPAGCSVGVVVDEPGAGFVVCPAAALLGFGEFAVLHAGWAPLGFVGGCVRARTSWISVCSPLLWLVYGLLIAHLLSHILVASCC